jgi:hypothetical protein
MEAEIYRKEGEYHELHESIATTNSDGDDAARVHNSPRRRLFATGLPKAEHTPSRMSWVVVIDEHGRQLRMHWIAVEDDV